MVESSEISLKSMVKWSGLVAGCVWVEEGVRVLIGGRIKLVGFRLYTHKHIFIQIDGGVEEK